MKVLKSKSFFNNKELTTFVNSEKILREDILIITADGNMVLFYYGEADEKE